MFRTLTPIIAIIVGLGLLFTYVRPTFEDIRSIQDETEDYAHAIDRADALRQRINELVAKQNSFSTLDLERLEAFLPDTVDEVSLMLDLDALADRHGLIFGNIQVTESDDQPAAVAVTSQADIDPAAPQDQQASQSVGVAFAPRDISYTVTGTYESFRRYLRDLEQSLTLMDVVELQFTESEGDLVSYNMTVRVYSFNSGNTEG